MAGKLLPWIDVGYRTDCQNQESGANKKRHGDGLEEIVWGKTWPRFLGGLGNGLESSQEVRDDLQGKEDRNKPGVDEMWFEICGRTGGGAGEKQYCENGEDRSGGPILKRGAGADAAVVEKREAKR